MKNYFLLAFCVMWGSSTLAMLNGRNYTIDQASVKFVEDFDTYLQAYNPGASAAFDFSQYDMESIAQDLEASKISGFQAQVFLDAPNNGEKTKLMALSVFYPLIDDGASIGTEDTKLPLHSPQQSSQRLQKRIKYGDNFLANIPNNTKYRAPFGVWTFKASCAAAIAATITYCTIGWYNKGKKKEERLSQIRWAIGAGAASGIGAFAYLYARSIH